MKDGFLDKLITRLDRFSPSEVQNLVTRLVREKGFMENVFEALREGLLIVSPEGYITFANHAAVSFFGLDAHKCIGQHIGSAIRGLEWSKVAKPDRVVNRDMEVFYPENLFLNVYLAPIHSPVEGTSEHLGHVILVRDITQSKLEVEEILESEKLNALTLLAAGVAHEIGNPLNAVDIHLQLMQRKLRKLESLASKDKDEMSKLLSTTQGEIRRLDSILKQFLHAVRPSVPNREKWQLHDILRVTLQSLESELSSRNARVSLELANSLPLLELDSDQIQQALYNLIRNAAQALPASGGNLWISSSSNDFEIELSVKDNGSGISPEHMGSLYEPFRTTKATGSGLGLLIVRRIIREHGGELEIESEEGVGTCVTIHLPRKEKHLRLLENNSSPPLIELED